MEPTQLLSIDRELFLDVVADNAQLVRGLLEALAGRVRDVMDGLPEDMRQRTERMIG